ncbi:MAG: hypothetical protein EOP21_02215 [Hyphomicrobiales bacterium]|nr:MAG: hypothetical protein EOP21_02215 [Hyphomicrobiales bacterium]
MNLNRIVGGAVDASGASDSLDHLIIANSSVDLLGTRVFVLADRKAATRAIAHQQPTPNVLVSAGRHESKVSPS